MLANVVGQQVDDLSFIWAIIDFPQGFNVIENSESCICSELILLYYKKHECIRQYTWLNNRVYIYNKLYWILHEFPAHSGTKSMAMHLKFQGGRRRILFTFLIRSGQMGWPIAIVFELYSQASAPTHWIVFTIPQTVGKGAKVGKRGHSTWGRAGYTRSNNIYALEYGGKLYTDSVFFSLFLATKRNKNFRFQIQKRFSLRAELSSSECWMRMLNANATRGRRDSI